MMTETVVNVQEAPNNNAANKPQQPGAPRQPESPLAWIKINVEYFKSTPGILKLVEFVSTKKYFYAKLTLPQSD